MYDNLAQAIVAVTDPATTAQDLMAIAQAYPSLWADVARHPNAYPDLLTWLTSVGDDTVRTAVAARTAVSGSPDSVPPTNVDPYAAPAKPHKLSWISTPKGKKILIGSGAGFLAVVLAVVLITTLVVIPRQRAEEAAAAASASAAAEQAKLDQEHQSVVDSFTKADTDCTQANNALSDAISHAQQTATTDPSTLDDLSLVDALTQAIATAQTVKPCASPTMAAETAAIQQQTQELIANTYTVTTAVSALADADKAVTASVQTKVNKEADEAEAQARKMLQGDVNLTDNDGFTINFAWTDISVVASVDSTEGKPGDVVVSYYMKANITVTNSTPGKKAPGPAEITITPYYDTNMCDYLPSDLASYRVVCQSVTIDGKSYYTNFWMSTTYDSNDMLDVGQKVVNPTHTGGVGMQMEVSTANASALQNLVSNPSLIAITSDMYPNNCVDHIDGGSCIIAGSDW